MHSLFQTIPSRYSFIGMNIGFIIMFTILFETTFAQSNSALSAFYSLDVPVDARSVAMGESFVAVGGVASSHIFNPASLASIQGVTVSYSRRGYTFIDPVTANYQYLTASIHTSLLSIGLFYNRYDDDYRMFLGAASGSVDVTDYNYVLGASLGTNIGENFRIGLVCKTFRIQRNRTFNDGPTVVGTSTSSTNNAMLFDVGAQYSTEVILTGSFLQDELCGGISLQNFGTDLRQGSMNTLDPQQLVPVPRYLRIGLAYRIERLPDQENEPTPFSLLVSGEYRNFLNAGDGQKDSRDFWGLGTELSFFEIASVRTGIYIAPFDRWYGKKGEASFRYGLGLNVPLRHIADIPWSVKCDYSIIPITAGLGGFRDSFPVFSVEVQYLEDIF